MSTLELPDGGTATIRDPKEVSERLRRPVTRLQMRLAVSPVGQILGRKAEATKAGDTVAAKAADDEMSAAITDDPNALALLDELNDALIVALVDDVKGVKLAGDAALDQPGPIYDALRAECAKYVTDLMPSFSPSPDPASPTPPSAT